MLSNANNSLFEYKRSLGGVQIRIQNKAAMLQPFAKVEQPITMGSDQEDTFLVGETAPNTRSLVATMNSPLPSGRRVIFPSLYGSLEPSSQLPAIPEQSARIISSRQHQEFLPRLEDEEAARVRSHLQHMLTLSPLSKRDQSPMKEPLHSEKSMLILALPQLAEPDEGQVRSQLQHLLPLSPLKTVPQTAPPVSGTPCVESVAKNSLSPAPLLLENEDKDANPPLKPKIYLDPPYVNRERSLSFPHPRARSSRQVLEVIHKDRELLQTPDSSTNTSSKPREIVPRGRFRSLSCTDQDNFVFRKGELKKALKPLPSILRSRRFAKDTLPSSPPEVKKTSSIGSDIPSLASSESQSSLDESEEEQQQPELSPLQRHQSELLPSQHERPRLPRGRSISFDPKIWVREFERTEMERQSIWYTPEEMGHFKQEAITRIMHHTGDLLPTGTGRTVQRPGKNVLFSHAALRDDDDDGPTTLDPKFDARRQFRDAVVKNEIRNILLVDPHDICLNLFSKSLKILLPHVSITTATSSAQALRCVEESKTRFDIILVEERLLIFHRQHAGSNNLASGSNLIQKLQSSCTKSLFIGVSAWILRDRDRLTQSGADLCWSKPPPILDQTLLDQLLQKLLIKRERKSAVEELFPEGATQ